MGPAGLVTIFLKTYYAASSSAEIPLGFRPFIFLKRSSLMPSPPPFFPSFLGNSDAFDVLLAQATAGDAPQRSPLQQILNSPFLLLGGLMALFYFIVLVPERRRKAEEATRLAGIKKNDRIVTIGGIHGVVSAVGEGDTITIRLDESGTNKMKIDRKAVARILSEKSTDDKSG
jgi:preprotein translocase subunit YajC